jgi:hypothetical protein
MRDSAGLSMCFAFSQIEIVKIKYPDRVQVAERVAGSELLVEVHVASV